MKKIKLYKYVIFVVILLLCTFAAVRIISTVQNKQAEKLNKKELFSYIVYNISNVLMEIKYMEIIKIVLQLIIK